MAARHAPDPPTAERVIREADARHDRALELLEAARTPCRPVGGAYARRCERRPRRAASRRARSACRRSSTSRAAGSPPTRWPRRRALLARGADPNGPAGEEWTNLSIACSRGDAALVKLLLERRRRAERQRLAVPLGRDARRRCTRLLLDHGATVRGTNALWHALDYDRIEPVRLLLEHGGDPNERSHWPALHHAVHPQALEPEFLRLLVEHGADPAARDRNGRTALPARVPAGRGGPRRDAARARRSGRPSPRRPRAPRRLERRRPDRRARPR